MTHSTAAKCHYSLAAIALAGALAIGATLAWAADAPAEVSAADKAAAIQVFNQARNLYQQGKFPEAAALDNKALQLDPSNINAQLLQKILRTKIGDSSGPEHNPNEIEKNPAKPKDLSLQQVSQIRLQELAPDETNLRGTIDHNALEDFWNKYIKNQTGTNFVPHDAFINPANFAGQVQQFKNVNDPDFLAHIQLASDPADLVEFRKTVHPFILKNCATSSCHGGDNAGDFHLLIPSAPVTDQILYTNFYIMSMYIGKDHGEMINRDNPELSLFLQYSLPPALATFTHPGKIEPHHFAKADDPQFKIMSDWVRSLALPRPNYGIVYDLPNSPATPTTHPATKPSPTHPTIPPRK